MNSCATRSLTVIRPVDKPILASTLLLNAESPEVSLSGDIGNLLLIDLMKVTSMFQTELTGSLKEKGFSIHTDKTSTPIHDAKLEFKIVYAEPTVWQTYKIVGGRQEAIAKAYGGLRKIIIQMKYKDESGKELSVIKIETGLLHDQNAAIKRIAREVADYTSEMLITKKQK